MTAPSRIPHGEAVRNAVRVEWMRLETVRDRVWAQGWLTDHGISSILETDGTLWMLEKLTRVPIRPGQVLALVPESGEFSVWDWRRFVEAHPGVGTDD